MSYPVASLAAPLGLLVGLALSPVLPPNPTTIHTSGATFNAIATVATGAVVRWTFGDGTTSTLATPPAVNNGTAAARTTTLEVTPRSALLSFNLGYDAGDGDQFMPYPNGQGIVPAQAITAIGGLEGSSGLEILAVSNSPIASLNVTGCTALRFIEAYYCHSLRTVVGLETCTSLVRVCFEECPLTALALRSPAIRDVRNRSQPGNLAAYTVVDFGSILLSNIWHLCIGSNGITAHGLEGRSLPALEEIYLWWSLSLGVGQVFTLDAPILRQIRANNTAYVGANLAGMHQLEMVDFSGCQFNAAAVDNVLMTLAGSQFNSLNLINLTDTTHPTELGIAAIATIQARRPSCSIQVTP